MLSAGNLKDLDDAGLKFIVGSRVTKAPADLANHFHWNGDVFTDGQIIDTVTPRHAKSTVNIVRHRTEPVWDAAGHPKSWRAVWQYSKRRAVRDNQTLNAPRRPGPQGRRRGEVTEIDAVRQDHRGRPHPRQRISRPGPVAGRVEGLHPPTSPPP
ncbi:hypothetical protein [Rhodococcus sp. ACPA1]|uniref:hypothetical protein n=1 Tax=Rhodococcus sp. ACPA1 TaxID=2028572 RepID=UPI00359C5A89